MHISCYLPLLPLASASLLPFSPQHIFSNPSDASTFTIPTAYESAVLARRILHLTPSGTLSTVFPAAHSDDDSELENRPSGLAGVPIGLSDYFADCESDGNPTILSMGIATSFKNVAAGSNISLSISWVPPYPPKARIGSTAKTTYSAANQPRFSLIGYLEKIPGHQVKSQAIGQCFTKTHPDAKYWLPGNPVHSSEWVRLVVQDIYWVGGFGDRAYIGWISPADFKNVTRKEWDAVKLPGEKKGWKEWTVDTFGSFGYGDGYVEL